MAAAIPAIPLPAPLTTDTGLVHRAMCLFSIKLVLIDFENSSTWSQISGKLEKTPAVKDLITSKRVVKYSQLLIHYSKAESAFQN